MKNHTSPSVHPVGTATPTASCGVLSALFSTKLATKITTDKTTSYAYKKSKNNPRRAKKSSAKDCYLSCFSVSEKSYAAIDLAQQLLILQELWLEKDKDEILTALIEKQHQVIAFVHWLAVPSLGVILSFSHQKCCQVEWL